MLAKIKKGDRVRCLVDYVPGYQFTKGKIYTADVNCNNNTVHVIADDSGSANGHNRNYFKLVRRATKRVEPTVRDSESIFQCSFKNLYIEPPAFGKLLALNGLAWTNRKKVNGSYVWGFEDGHIVTTNCPLTGNSAKGKLTNIGFAQDVGVEGTKSFRDRVAKFLKRNGTFNEFVGDQRRYV